MKTGAWFAGTPEELVTYLKELEAAAIRGWRT